MHKNIAQKIARETNESYNKMAKEFSDTRAQFWDELAFLAEHIERDDHVLDIGCGNGRFAPLVSARHAHYDGLDYSAGLIAEAKHKFPEHAFATGDATALPFPDNSFDIAFSFAVIHHIPSRELRKQFITEAFRVLHPGSKFILTAWNLWTAKHFAQLFTSAVESLIGKNTLDVCDVMLTFGKQKHQRYVHACTKREIATLLHECGFAVVAMDTIARKSGEQNIIVVAQKPME
jgi:ubiquinone/menaquinone biosynthesis C-methylase UbiE